MAYTIVDILDKFILIEQKGQEIFQQIEANDEFNEKVRLMAKIFSKEEKFHSQLYERFKQEISQQINIEIDFMLYDQASKLIYNFLNDNRVQALNAPKELLSFCLDFEKENLSLVLSIQGILVKKQADMDTEAYKLLTKIIEQEKKHIKNIEMFI